MSRIIYDARTVVEDRRAGAVGGITLAFQIWESVCVPMLLYGLEVFNVIPKKTMKALDNIALKQIRVTMGIGKQGYVIPCLLFECGIPPMCDRILYYRLLFFFHLSSLEEDSLAGRLYKAQLRNPEIPSIVQQCRKILDEWNIGDPKAFTKNSWKRMIQKIVRNKLKTGLIEAMKK